MTVPNTPAESNGGGESLTLPTVKPYEELLEADAQWAMRESSLFFAGQSRVHDSLARICHRLDELRIPYALLGGMALFAYGYRRFTEDIDLLLTRRSFRIVHASLNGRGWSQVFCNRKNLWDAETGVRIEFSFTGHYAGDGQPNPITFPDPKDVFEIRDGIKVLQLPRLIELKLASYMTGKARSKDLGDVEELIRTLKLPQEFAAQLNPYVAPLFREKWDEINS